MNRLSKKQQTMLYVIILSLAVCFLLCKLLLTERFFIYSAITIGVILISISIYITAKQLCRFRHGKMQLLMMFLSTLLVAASALYLHG